MNNLRHSLSLFFGGRRKIEAESKRLTEEYKLREAERKRLEQEKQKLEAAFRHAAADNDLLLLEAMIQMEVDVNAPDPETGRTALIMAADYGHLTALTYLLSERASVYLKAKNGHTAVDFARAKGRMEMVELLESTHRTAQEYGGE